MSKDTIGDFLTVIRNGVMVSKRHVECPYSKLVFELAELLKQEGFIRRVAIVEEEGSVKKRLKIDLKYVKFDNNHEESAIHEIKRSSRPGRRYYTSSGDIKPVIGTLGVSLLTTNQGVMTHKKAKELGIGGEVICTVW